MATKKTTEMDAIALLKSDHRAVEALFEKYETTNGSATKARIAQTICLELTVHAMIEEEFFYPGVKDAVDEEIYTEAYVEHDGAKALIADIEAGTPADEFYDAKVKVLSEQIKHHVKEEEQRDGMFAQARKGDVGMVELGKAMAARKKELTAQFKRDGLPRPVQLVMKGEAPARGSLMAA